MQASKPQNLFLRRHRKRPPFMIFAFFPITILIATVVGTSLTENSIDLDEYVTSAVGLSLLGGMMAVFSIIGLLWHNTIERRQIDLVFDNQPEVFPQFDSHEQWLESAHDYYQYKGSFYRLPVMNLLLINVIFIGVTIFALIQIVTTSDEAIILVAAMVGFAWFANGYFLGDFVTKRWQLSRDYERWQNIDIPHVFIGKDGFYHEAFGYFSTKQSRETSLLAPAMATSIKRDPIPKHGYQLQQFIDTKPILLMRPDNFWVLAIQAVEKVGQRLSRNVIYTIHVPEDMAEGMAARFSNKNPFDRVSRPSSSTGFTRNG